MAQSKPKLLIVEDDEGLQTQLKWAFEGFEVFVAGTRDEALTILRAEMPPVVTLDLGLPPDPDGTSEGFAVLDAIMAQSPQTKVIIASGHGARESALDAIAAGAYDFYSKPVDIAALELVVNRALNLHRIEAENRRLAEKVGKDKTVLGTLITGAPEMVKVARTIERVANTDASIILLGASGTGKELLARGLHDASPRRDGAFVAINCAAIPENLLESELFGHEKGAFTGAYQSCAGKFEQANGGTLLLDEISEMDINLQAKLLRVLQEKEVERIGGKRTIALDVRVLATTNRNLKEQVAAGKFREDLYYRLCVFPLMWKPLRERKADIIPLAHRLIAMKQGQRSVLLDPSAELALMQHNWPGNIRELDNVIQRALILCSHDRITGEDIFIPDAAMNMSADVELESELEAGGALGEDLKKREFELIIDTLRTVGGSKKQTAEKLGISPRTLRYKLARMREYGIDVERVCA